AIAMVVGGSTREDLRDQKSAASGKAKARAFQFVYKPKDGPFRLAIAFHKSRVAKAELIDALKGVIKQLESGALEITRKG
ncbi:MAG: hypothetical protein ABI968_12210, partial [Acidobacteriota bacterium]